MNTKIALNNFSAGIFSRKLAGRTDLKGYYQSCKTLENAIIMPTGGITKLVGTKFKYDIGTDYTRLFTVKDFYGDVWHLFFQDKSLKVLKDGDTSLTATITTPYAEADIDELQFAVIDDPSTPATYLFIAHKNYYFYRYECITQTFTQLTGGGSPVLVGTYPDKPVSVGFMQQRMMLVAGRNLYLSKVASILDFTTGTGASDAIVYELYSDENFEITTIIGANPALIGTTIGEFIIGYGNQGAVITPDNIGATLVSNYTSTYVKPKQYFSKMVMLGYNRQRLLGYFYDNNTQSFLAENITLTIDEEINSGIKDFIICNFPYNIIWMITNDNNLYGHIDEPLTGVAGWFSFTTDGDVISMSNVKKYNNDILYLIIKRDNNYYLEELDFNTKVYLHSFIEFDLGDKKNITTITYSNPLKFTVPSHGLTTGDYVRFYDVGDDFNHKVFEITVVDTDNFTIDVDGTQYSGSLLSGQIEKVSKIFSGLSHLEGYTVYGFGDNYVLSPKIVSSGQVEFDNFVNQVYIGLNYSTIISPMGLEYNFGNYTTVGDYKTILKAYLQLYETNHFKIGKDLSSLQTIPLRDYTDNMDSMTAYRTQTVKVDVNIGFYRDVQFYVVSDLPLQFTVLSIIPYQQTNR